MILGVEGFIAASIGVLLAAYYLRWWALPVLAAVFICIGVVVAVFSPVVAVEPLGPPK